MESDFEICLSPEQAGRFCQLKSRFGISFTIQEQEFSRAPELAELNVDHATPVTRLGSIERPLIFPHAIVDYCQDQWQPRRDVRFSFVGLMTPERKLVIERWIRRSFPQSRVKLAVVSAPSDRPGTRGHRFLRKLLGLRRRSVKVEKVHFDDVLVWSSNRGREFPIKAWDDEYWKVLTRSQFVICPDGDYKWSYRFFEAALCGAIPIVESRCEAYQGFRYCHIDDPIESLIWRPEDAEHNARICKQRLTIPRDELNAELLRLWKSRKDEAPAGLPEIAKSSA
jgi:hypothetical protein